MTEPERDFIKTLEGMLSVAAQNAADNVCTKKITAAVKSEMSAQMPSAIKKGIVDFTQMIGMDVSNVEGIIAWQKNMSFLASAHMWSKKIKMVVATVVVTAATGFIIYSKIS